MTLPKTSNEPGRVVIVTGCDHGLGADIVHELHQNPGLIIYATCLTQDAVQTYNAQDSTRLRAVLTDVTKQSDVDRLQAQIEEECPQGVYALLNNAGIIGGNYIDLTEIETYQKSIEVNYLGVIRITKALLPSLRRHAQARALDKLNRKTPLQPRARVVGISSIAGQYCAPGYSSYSASKHATEAFLDTLRIELAPWEIDVCMLEPFSIQTPMMAKGVDQFNAIWQGASPNTRRMYGDAFRQSNVDQAEKTFREAMPTILAVQTIVRTIQDPKGARKDRIVVASRLNRVIFWFLTMIPAWLLDKLTWMAMRKNLAWASDPHLFEDAKTR
ncbi:hypothetical protein BGW38_003550 [Lunasporangiospora selenospora]|uniref:Uncharacterized protein n=1 Tax=Lunasporangiospora selenospora TaxID=979761 RepID=A0A9P6G0K1_9FUNG|nr:hypothetical protein BGW38_003550 [Lunasporangiospora selenospora]